MKVYDPIHGPRTVKVKCPVVSIPTAKLQDMTEAELRARRDELFGLLHDMQSEERGRPHWFKGVEERRSERGAYSCEIRRINTILMRRQHAALETMIDRDATANAVAG